MSQQQQQEQQQEEEEEDDDFEDERVLLVDFREEEEEEKSDKRRVDEVVVFGKSSSSSSSCNDDDDDDDDDNIKTHRWRGKSPLRDKSSLKHFMEILLRWIKEEGEVERRPRSKKIVLLAGGDGCSGVKLLRVFQLCLSLLRRRRRRKQHLQKTTTTIAMIIEHEKLVPVMKTNGNRQAKPACRR